MNDTNTDTDTDTDSQFPTPNQDLLDRLDVLRALRVVVGRHPTQVNPTKEDGPTATTCLYTSETDPDHHCLAGAVMLELGLRLPPEGALVGGSPDRYRLTRGALALLSCVQSVADRRYSPPGVNVPTMDCTPWGVAYVRTCVLEGVEPW